MRKAKKPWTATHIAILKAHYRKHDSKPISNVGIAKRLGRSRFEIKAAAVKLGLSNKSRPKLRGAATHNWKGNRASSSAKHRRAQRLVKLGLCERCGKQGEHRHHKDDDPGNNEPSNIQVLCCKCHFIIDGRLERLHARNRELAKIFKPPKPCCNCKRPYKPLRQHRCRPCYRFWKRHHRERRKREWKSRSTRDYGFRPDAVYRNQKNRRRIQSIL